MPRKLSSTSKSRVRRRLTTTEIKDAIHAVRVQSTGKKWSVKKVADSKIRHFDSKDKALSCAVDLAREAKWSVVVHYKNGKIRRFTPPMKTLSV